MHLPDEAPRIPKLPFLIGDGALLLTAVFIARQSSVPLTLEPLAAIVACVGLGTVLAALPYVIDYARRQDGLLSERQNALEALARTTQASAEQISVAASGLHTIAELVQKNLKLAEQLPHKLHESINEFYQQRDESIVAENEALTQEVNTLRASEAEKLETAADRVHKASTELAKTEADIRRQLAELKECMAVAIVPVPSPAAVAPAVSAPPPPVSEPTPPSPIKAAAPAAPKAAASEAADAVNPTDEAAPPRSRPKRAKVADSGPPFDPGTGLLNGDPPVSVPGDEFLPLLSDAEETPASSELSQEPATVERAVSTDGATRLVATAYIGIGNRLYVRGEGPGLSWDKGVPLRFVSIGKWRWETAEAVRPVTIKLYKNDEVECIGLGPVRIEPGQQAEVTASF